MENNILENLQLVAEIANNHDVWSVFVNALMVQAGDVVSSMETVSPAQSFAGLRDVLMSLGSLSIQDYTPDSIYSNYLNFELLEIAKESSLHACAIPIVLVCILIWLWSHEPEEGSQIEDMDDLD